MSGKNYVHQLDAKNRMRIPAKLREELGSNYSITVGTGNCLLVYTEEQMQKVFAKHRNVVIAKVAKYRPARRCNVNKSFSFAKPARNSVFLIAKS